MTELHLLVEQNVELIHQGLAVLEKMPDPLYAQAEPELGSSSVGAHVRHLIDFYTCLLRDLGAGRVDYDERTRDRLLERDRLHAMARLREITAALSGTATPGRDVPLEVRVDCEDDAAPCTPSSLARELQALLAHTVHHYAAIAMILRLNGESVPADFGVAPSTLRYRRERSL